MRGLVLVLLAFAAAAPSASAATVTWDGGGGDGQWNTAANWSGDTIPGADDEAVLPAAGGTITLSGTARSVRRLIHPGETFGPGVTTVFVVDGTKLTITGTGLLKLLEIDVINDGEIELTGTASLEVLQGKGDGQVGNTGPDWWFSLGDTSVAEPNDGTLTFSGDNTANGAVGDTVPGSGLVRIPAGPGSPRLRSSTFLFAIHAAVENDGTIEAGSPRAIYLAPRSPSPVSDGDFITNAEVQNLGLGPRGAGTIELGPSASVNGPGAVWVALQAFYKLTVPLFGGVVRIADGATFDVGTLVFLGGPTLDLDTDGSAGRLRAFEYDQRRGTGDLTVTGPVVSEIIGHGFGETGVTDVQGPLKLGGASVHDGATLRTGGTTTMTDGTVALTSGGKWLNAGALTADDTDDFGDLPVGFDASTGTLLRNTGSLTVPAGEAVESGGTFEHVGGTVTVAGRLGSGAARFVQSGGTTAVAGELRDGVTLGGGVLSGGGSVKSLAHDGGTVDPGASPGTLTVAGDYTAGPGATLRAELASTDAYDVLQVGGTATLAGTLAVVPGFTPAPGDAFRIVRAGARTGTFGAVTGAGSLVTSYQADGATLTAPVPAATDTSAPPVVVGGPAPVVTPVPPRTPQTALPSFASVATLPSARRCVSRRRFRIRLKVPRGVTVRDARVRVNGKLVRTVRGSRLTAPVDLRGLPKGRATVAIELRLADGRAIRGSRRYRTCAPRRR